MADVYGVTPARVAEQVPGLFPSGFSAATRPPDTAVTAWIAAADAIADMSVQRVAGVAPAQADNAADIAEEYIVNFALARLMATVYAGKDPQGVAAAVKGYEDTARALLTAIRELGTQSAGTGTIAARVRGVDMAAARELLVTDADIGQGARGGRLIF